MPDISGFHQWIVYAHIVGVFIFLLAHGVSAGVLFRLRGERNPTVVRTLLDLSSRTFGVMGLGFLIWFFGGILAGFSGNYWTAEGHRWIWASLAVAIVVTGLMTPLAAIYLNRIRTAVGIDTKTRAVDKEMVVDAETLDAAIRSGRPMLVAAIGLGGVAILAWLMMFKPF